MSSPIPPNDTQFYVKDEIIEHNIDGNIFNISSQYDASESKLVGRGACGVIVKFKDVISKEAVVIKKFFEIESNDPADWKCCWKRSLREIEVLHCLKHPNIVELKDVLISNSNNHLGLQAYMVLECMDYCLHKVIQGQQVLTIEHATSISYQILKGLEYIHSANIIHRDLKPDNILISSDCTVKICDFGLACAAVDIDTNHTHKMTNYVVTRWYRAPEIILNPGFYTKAIDIWSVGCILAEIFLKRPIFMGNSYKETLTNIYRAIGKPTNEEIDHISNDYAQMFIRLMVCADHVDLAQKFPMLEKNSPCMQLIYKLLTLNPIYRITVHDALNHEFFHDLSSHKQHHNHQPTCAVPDLSTLFSYEMKLQHMLLVEHQHVYQQRLRALEFKYHSSRYIQPSATMDDTCTYSQVTNVDDFRINILEDIDIQASIMKANLAMNHADNEDDDDISSELESLTGSSHGIRATKRVRK